VKSEGNHQGKSIHARLRQTQILNRILSEDEAKKTQTKTKEKERNTAAKRDEEHVSEN
jgi:hypothetical protein